jgi:hypothetical protein
MINNEARKQNIPELPEADILEVFKKLNLSTVSDRQEFLKLEKLGQVEPFGTSQDSNPPQPLTIGFDRSTEAIHR